jgi:hypothetical protein
MPDLTAAELARLDMWRAYLDGDLELDELPIGCATAVTPADPRLVFLERAAARLRLVKSCDMPLDDAVHGLVEAFEDIVGCIRLAPTSREEP